MTMSIIITGVNGFVGRHLARELHQNGHTVIGIALNGEIAPDIKDVVSSYVLTDLAHGWPKLPDVDAIIHLAGLAAVGPSFDHPQDYLTINSSIVTHMCEYYLTQKHRPRIVMVSSGAIYDPQQPMPINESSPIAYTSPYTVSKVLLENQAAYYRTRGIECVVVRPFNHIGPDQLPGFLVPDLATKIMERSQASDPIHVGNLATKRDYTDVRDVAVAYRLLATAPVTPKHLVYNVCSGTSHSGEEVLQLLSSAFGITPPQTITDQSLIRPNDIMDIRGDSHRLQQEFSWQPHYTFAETISDYVSSVQ